MNILPRDKQIEVIAALCDGLGIRATARITGVNRETVGTLALRVGRGYAELHDRMMVGLPCGSRYTAKGRRASKRDCPELQRRSKHDQSAPGLT
jgi:hypothetical protein